MFDAIEELRDEADESLASSIELLRNHERFAAHMEVLLDRTAQHPSGHISRPTELLSLGEQILAQSSVLTSHSQAMQSQLNYVMSIIKEIRQRELSRGWWQKMLRFLTKAFNVLAIVLSAAAFVVPLVAPGPGIIIGAACGTGASLAKAASEVCRRMHDGTCPVVSSFLSTLTRLLVL